MLGSQRFWTKLAVTSVITLLLLVGLAIAVESQVPPLTPLHLVGPIQHADELDQLSADVPSSTPPPLPDLDVLYISREPRYQRYHVKYPGGIPIQVPGTENARRWPEPGEVVTFTAYLANKGPVTSQIADFWWLLDGAEIASGTLPALAPGLTATASLTWTWVPGAHTVAFEETNSQYLAAKAAP